MLPRHGTYLIGSSRGWALGPRYGPSALGSTWLYCQVSEVSSTRLQLTGSQSQMFQKMVGASVDGAMPSDRVLVVRRHRRELEDRDSVEVIPQQLVDLLLDLDLLGGVELHAELRR